jgi:hypothetical protein
MFNTANTTHHGFRSIPTTTIVCCHCQMQLLIAALFPLFMAAVKCHRQLPTFPLPPLPCFHCCRATVSVSNAIANPVHTMAATNSILQVVGTSGGWWQWTPWSTLLVSKRSILVNISLF